MKELDKIKQEYAKTVECDNWAQFILSAGKGEILMALNVISQEYNKKQLELFAEWLEYNGKYMTHKDQIKSFLKTE